MDRPRVPAGYRAVLRFLIGGRRPGLRDPGFGLIMLEVWPTVFSASLIVLGQLWRIDRLGLLFEEQRPE